MSLIGEAIVSEIKERVELSQQYSDNIKTAKTNLKKSWYKKKLKTNNEVIYQLIVSLEKINKNKNTRESDVQTLP